MCIPPPARSLPCRERCCSTSLNAVSLVSYFPWYFFSFSRYIVTFRRPTRNGARGSRPDPVPGTKDVLIIRLAIFPTSPSFLYPLFVLFLHLTTYPSTRLQQYFSSEADFKSRQHTLYQQLRHTRLIAQHAFHREVGSVSAPSPNPVVREALRSSPAKEPGGPKGRENLTGGSEARQDLPSGTQRRGRVRQFKRGTPHTRENAWEPQLTPLSHSDICKIIFAVILPPLGVFLEVGCGASLCINICLTILGTLFSPDAPKILPPRPPRGAPRKIREICSLRVPKLPSRHPCPQPRKLLLLRES